MKNLVNVLGDNIGPVEDQGGGVKIEYHVVHDTPRGPQVLDFGFGRFAEFSNEADAEAAIGFFFNQEKSKGRSNNLKLRVIKVFSQE